jgi:hypothetical protein
MCGVVFMVGADIEGCLRLGGSRVLNRPEHRIHCDLRNSSKQAVRKIGAAGAATFLGVMGLVYSSGFDGLLYAIRFLMVWPIILFLIAEPLRNLGREIIDEGKAKDEGATASIFEHLKV